MGLFKKSPDITAQKAVDLIQSDNLLNAKLKLFSEESKDKAISYIRNYIQETVIPSIYVENQGPFYASPDYTKSAEQAFNILFEEGKSKARLFLERVKIR